MKFERRCYSTSEDSTTSKSDTCSSERGENQDERLAKTGRFHVVAKEDNNKYDLPDELAEHANEYYNKFMPEKEIKKSILSDDAVQITYKELINWTVSCEIF